MVCGYCLLYKQQILGHLCSVRRSRYREDWEPIEDEVRIATLEFSKQRRLSISLKTNLTILSDDVGARVVTQAVEAFEVWKKETGSIVQKVLKKQHQAINALCKKTVQSVGQANARKIVNKNGVVFQILTSDTAVKIAKLWARWSFLL